MASSTKALKEGRGNVGKYRRSVWYYIADLHWNYFNGMCNRIQTNHWARLARPSKSWPPFCHTILVGSHLLLLCGPWEQTVCTSVNVLYCFLPFRWYVFLVWGALCLLDSSDNFLFLDSIKVLCPLIPHCQFLITSVYQWTCPWVYYSKDLKGLIALSPSLVFLPLFLPSPVAPFAAQPSSQIKP